MFQGGNLHDYIALILPTNIVAKGQFSWDNILIDLENVPVWSSFCPKHKMKINSTILFYQKSKQMNDLCLRVFCWYQGSYHIWQFLNLLISRLFKQVLYLLDIIINIPSEIVKFHCVFTQSSMKNLNLLALI